MIVYYKLADILKERNMQWKDLQKAGMSVNTPTKFSQNKTMNTEIIDKVCTFLKVQPADIMEWVPDAEYGRIQHERRTEEKLALEKQIKELQEKLKQI